MKTHILKVIVIFTFLLSFLVISGAETSSYSNDHIFHAIQNSLPSNWKIVERKSNKIPHGHYWGLEYKGRLGQEIVIQGPTEVMFRWRDRDGKFHQVPLAKETLKVWIMPPDYSESWKRHFMFHRPIPAMIIVAGEGVKVYGFQTHRIVNENEFKDLLKQATETAWPNSPHDHNGCLSWSNWRKDLSDALNSVVEKTIQPPNNRIQSDTKSRSDLVTIRNTWAGFLCS
jgi:hypothetical protein